jgi:hypothetical protein
MTAEEKFKEMLIGMVVERIDLPKSIWYYKNGKFMIYQDIKTGICLINYLEIWSVLESEFGFNYQQIKELTTNILKQNLKHKVVTTASIAGIKNKPEKISNIR